MTPIAVDERLSAGETLETARRQLRDAAFEPSTREAGMLLAHVLGLDEAAILAHPERPLGADQEGRFSALLRRRLGGEPIAYLVGEKEFFGRPFAVDDRVLIPRPETEHLIEVARRLPLPERPRILDVGAGSGSIAMTLALEIPGARVVATDFSPVALTVAAVNRDRLDLRRRVALIATDLADGLDLASFDLVVSNPPYIAPSEAHSLSVEITGFEPHTALFAPPDGMDVIRRLLAELGTLRPSTPLVIEFGAGQDEALRSASRDSAFELHRITSDYAGIPRIALLQRR